MNSNTIKLYSNTKKQFKDEKLKNVDFIDILFFLKFYSSNTMI